MLSYQAYPGYLLAQASNQTALFYVADCVLMKKKKGKDAVYHSVIYCNTGSYVGKQLCETSWHELTHE